MSDLVKEITNIQTFELLEERIGISISGVTAILICDDRSSDDPYYQVSIKAEIIALNGGQVEHSFKIQATAIDSVGNVIGGVYDLFSKDEFFGIEFLDRGFQVHTTDVQTVKVFPVRW